MLAVDGTCIHRSIKATQPYGRIDVFGFKGVYVHRVAYWLANGGELNLRKEGDRSDSPLVR